MNRDRAGVGKPHGPNLALYLFVCLLVVLGIKPQDALPPIYMPGSFYSLKKQTIWPANRKYVLADPFQRENFPIIGIEHYFKLN